MKAPRYPALVSVRVSDPTSQRIDRNATRRSVDRATIARWWLDELPEDYVPRVFRTVAPEPPTRLPTGIAELDQALGGGVVLGDILVVAAKRGLGKTTLLLQACDGFAFDGRKAFYAGGESDRDLVLEQAKRLDIANPDVLIASDPAGLSMEKLLSEVGASRAKLLVLDPVNVAYVDAFPAKAGTRAQVATVLNLLSSVATTHGVAVVVVDHLTKDEEISCPSTVRDVASGVLRIQPKHGYVSKDGLMIDTMLREIFLEGGPTRSLMELTEWGFRAPSVKALRMISEQT